MKIHQCRTSIIAAVAICVSVSSGFGQPNSPSEKFPVAYANVREADMMWSKRIWRLIDMREKMNQPYYYPFKANNNRSNLITVLQTAIQQGRLTAYDPFFGDDFQVQLDPEVASQIGIWVDSVEMPEPDPPYNMRIVAITTDFDPSSVKRFKIKEDWFFDHKRSVMEVRIIGICPVMEVYDRNTGELRGLMDMYWINFDEARKVLAQYQLYNPYNNSQRLSYDEAFRIRLFSSLIYKEDNIQDRRLDEFMPAHEALYAAEDIKQQIMKYEHDMWDY